MGTVGYMSPEQALGKPLDFRSDQFAVGSILYEMVTGRRAFARPSAPETLAAIIREEPEPLMAAAPTTPTPLAWFTERCLAKDPEERYASTRDLARDLARLRDGLSESSVSGSTVAAASGAPRARPWLLWGALAPPPRPRSPPPQCGGGSKNRPCFAPSPSAGDRWAGRASVRTSRP